MSGIVGSRFNIRGSGLVGSLGTDGQAFTSSGAGAGAVFEAAGGGDFVTVSAADSTVRTTATIDVSLPAGYQAFQLAIRMWPNDDNQKLYARFSIDDASSYVSAGYYWGFLNINSDTDGDLDQEHGDDEAIMQINGSEGYDGNEGGYHIIDILPSEGNASYSSNNNIAWRGWRMDTSANFRATFGSGVLWASGQTDRATHFRLYYDDGTIWKHHYTLYGKKT